MKVEELEHKARVNSLVYDTKYAEDDVLEEMLSRPQDFVDGAIMEIVQLLREKANRDGFIAGAKENGVIWHDLRKNPDDLPNNNTNVIVKTDSVTEYAVFHKRLDGTYFWSCFFSPIERHPKSVIAWCELPKFEVEE